MTSSFRRLGPMAQRVFLLAQAEARGLQHGYLGPQHLLLGLLRLPDGPVADVLQEVGLTHERALWVIREMVTPHGYGKESPSSAHLPVAPHTRALLDAAAEDADRTGDRTVDPRHLLLALARDEKGFIKYVLSRTGVATDTFYDVVGAALRRTDAGAGDGRPAPQRGANEPSLLAKLGVDLTDEARQGLLDPVVGRHAEIARVIQVLRRRKKNNVVLIGEPGVGKTAIVEGLAQRIADGALASFESTSVWSLDIGTLLAGAVYRGQFEERLKAVIDEVIDSDAVLFIDELHMIVGAGSTENAVDAANILKPALARGKLRVIGATTFDEYSKHIEKDRALKRRLQPLVVEEPDIDETLRVLQGVRSHYEDHHGLRFTEDALETAARLSRYVPDLYLPGKAIDLLDEAASWVWYQSQTGTGEPAREVTSADIAQVLSAQTQIPVGRLVAEGRQRTEDVEEVLAARVIGQDHALRTVAQALQRGHVGLGSASRPIASFLLAGPPGVGKTELAKAIAGYLLGSDRALVQLDMSEYQEPHTVSRLVGAPPGYVGYDEGGQLTEAVRRRPYCVLLLDNLDRAHPDVLNIFCQVLDAGFLADGRGRRVDFGNATIVATAGYDPDVLRRQSGMGFRAEDADESPGAQYERVRADLSRYLRDVLGTEILHRIDNLVVFEPLRGLDVERLVDLLIDQVRPMLTDRRVTLLVTAAARSWLAEQGYDIQHGARMLRQVIHERVVGPVLDGLVDGRFSDGDVVDVDVDAGAHGGALRIAAAGNAAATLADTPEMASSGSG